MYTSTQSLRITCSNRDRTCHKGCPTLAVMSTLRVSSNSKFIQEQCPKSNPTTPILIHSTQGPSSTLEATPAPTPSRKVATWARKQKTKKRCCHRLWRLKCNRKSLCMIRMKRVAVVCGVRQGWMRLRENVTVSQWTVEETQRMFSTGSIAMLRHSK